MKKFLETVTIGGAALVSAGCCLGVAANSANAPCQAGGVQAAAEPAAGQGSCANGEQPATDGLLDDFEDGNTQVALLGGRDGYWYKAVDDKGSVLEPADFGSSEGGADGSSRAMYVHGKTSSSDGAWGASVAMNFVNDGTYDASKYIGITFKAKAGKGARKFRVKVGDVNTHQKLGVCTQCWNHFGTEVRLTEEWAPYTIYFDKLRQADGWGDPRPPAVTQAEIFNLDFSIDKGVDYELWIDDVSLVECKP